MCLALHKHGFAIALALHTAFSATLIGSCKAWPDLVLVRATHDSLGTCLKDPVKNVNSSSLGLHIYYKVLAMQN